MGRIDTKPFYEFRDTAFEAICCASQLTLQDPEMSTETLKMGINTFFRVPKENRLNFLRQVALECSFLEKGQPFFGKIRELILEVKGESSKDHPDKVKEEDRDNCARGKCDHPRKSDVAEGPKV